MWKYLNAFYLCRENWVEIFGTLHFLPALVCVWLLSMTWKVEDKAVVLELYNMHSLSCLFCLVIVLLSTAPFLLFLPQQMLFRSLLCQAGFPVLCCLLGDRSLNSWKKWLKITYRNLSRSVSFVMVNPKVSCLFQAVVNSSRECLFCSLKAGASLPATSRSPSFLKKQRLQRSALQPSYSV